MSRGELYLRLPGDDWRSMCRDGHCYESGFVCCVCAVGMGSVSAESGVRRLHGVEWSAWIRCER